MSQESGTTQLDRTAGKAWMGMEAGYATLAAPKTWPLTRTAIKPGALEGLSTDCYSSTPSPPQGRFLKARAIILTGVKWLIDFPFKKLALGVQ